MNTTYQPLRMTGGDVRYDTNATNRSTRVNRRYRAARIVFCLEWLTIVALGISVAIGCVSQTAIAVMQAPPAQAVTRR